MDSFGVRFLLLIRINECASGRLYYTQTHTRSVGWFRFV